jgi:hypothetical protein
MGSVGNEGAKGHGEEGLRCCQVISSVLAHALLVLYEYKSTNTDASAPASRHHKCVAICIRFVNVRWWVGGGGRGGSEMEGGVGMKGVCLWRCRTGVRM